MKIAVRSPNWIGDCIMCLPALRALRACFPSAHISLVTRRHLQAVFENLEEITEIITIPTSGGIGNTFKAASQLKSHGFQMGLLFTNSFNSALLFKLAGIPDTIGYVKDMRGFMLKRKLPFPVDCPKHHVYFYTDLAAKAAEGNTDMPPQLKLPPAVSPFITQRERDEVRSLLSGIGVDPDRVPVGISPAAAYGTAKQWLPERFAQLTERLLEACPFAPLEAGKAGCGVLLFGSPDEKEKNEIILGGLDNRADAHNLAGKLTLRQAIVAVSMCSAFVCNDSGMMHVAASLGVPLAAVFGPTLPHKTAPHAQNKKDVRVLYHKVCCAPCKHRECPTDHACMKAVSVDEVYGALASLATGAPLLEEPTLTGS
ncbi:MAG: lipopolysaccharide heptosyltransferase II [bacterium]|nr:lipopolysaccharide heptosyltransferase II [bacterium]